MNCTHEIHSYRTEKFGKYQTIFRCKKCNHSFSAIQYPYREQEEATINFLNNNPNIISIEDAVNHVKHLLNEEEAKYIHSLICSSFETNMFWAKAYLGFNRYYGFTNIQNRCISEKGHLVAIEIKFGDAYDMNKPYGYIEKLHDLPTLPILKERDVISGLHHNFNHVRKTKYGFWAESAVVEQINDDDVTLRHDYIHYKKTYTVMFNFPKKEVELNIARIKWSLNQCSK